MTTYIATLIDTTGIQSYIFNSNRLRENIGASHLVAQATGQWVQDALKAIKISNWNTPIEAGKTLGELIYAGGGNTVLVFQDLDTAKEFTKKLTYRVLQEAPGLNLVVAHQPFAWHEEKSLQRAINILHKEKIDHKKRSLAYASVPMLGLGVTAACRSTGLVAITTAKEDDEQNDYLVSREVSAKHKVIRDANAQLADKLLINSQYAFPSRADKLGRSKGESSYLAIVHVDGNSMGDRIKKYGDRFPENREYVNKMRLLSQQIEKAGEEAMCHVIDDLIKALPRLREELGEAELDENGQEFLPIRPLVYGGDDTTFVCDGRLGLSLATRYLKYLQDTILKDDEPLYACAGVCIVKTHYPFARAYALSKELCRSAKKLVRERDKEGRLSAIDWHITGTGLLGSLEEIRKREYQVATGSLTIRPMPLEQSRMIAWHCWSDFSHVVKVFRGEANAAQEELENWREKRNKVMALREVLRQGEEAVKNFCQTYRLKQGLPKFPSANDAETDGYSPTWSSLSGKQVCRYFDAIELIDFYLALEETAND